MLDIRMKDENTSWQEWYEENPRLRKCKEGAGLVMGVGINDLSYVVAIDIGKRFVYGSDTIRHGVRCWTGVTLTSGRIGFLLTLD